jgi:hypothetical protein
VERGLRAGTSKACCFRAGIANRQQKPCPSMQGRGPGCKNCGLYSAALSPLANTCSHSRLVCIVIFYVSCACTFVTCSHIDSISKKRQKEQNKKIKDAAIIGSSGQRLLDPIQFYHAYMVVPTDGPGIVYSSRCLQQGSRLAWLPVPCHYPPFSPLSPSSLVHSERTALRVQASALMNLKNPVNDPRVYQTAQRLVLDKLHFNDIHFRSLSLH